MDFDFDNFEMNESRRTLNKDEEIKKLTLDEDLSEIKRAQIILMKGQQKQKLAIYNNLHHLLPLSFDSLFQYIRGDIMDQSEEVQIAAAKSLENICIKSEEIIQLAIHFIQLYQEKLVQAWLSVFKNQVLLIDYKEYASFLEKIIIQLSDSKQPELCRLVGAKMITCITPILKNDIRGPLLDKARMLCSDQDSDIRSYVADEMLSCLMQNLTGELLEQYFIDKINELLYDTQINVKKNMTRTFLKYQHKLPRSDYNLKTLNIFLDCLSTNNIELLSIAVMESGNTLMNIQDLIDDNFLNKFATIYQKFGTNINEEIRKWYLYNLPGVITYLQDGPYANQILTPYAELLIQDKCHSNRLLACKILHEISKQFDVNEYSYVLQKIWHLFELIVTSEDIECILAMNIPEMYKILLNGDQDKEDKKKIQFKDINMSLQKIFEKCYNNYNQCQICLTYLLQLIEIINIQQFEIYFLQLLYHDTKTLTCDQLQMKCLAKYFGICKDYSIQLKIKDTMNIMFFKGNNNKRVRYIFWVSEIPQYVSRKRFNDFNFNQVITYGNDKTASVQIQLIKNLQKICHYLDPFEYNFIRNIKGITQQNLANQIFAQISQQKLSQNFQDEQNQLQSQEDQQYQNFQKLLKIEKPNDFISNNNDLVNKYLKKPISKLMTQHTKKTPSASTSVRLVNQSFGESTPQYQQQQQQVKVRRYTDAHKAPTAKPSSRQSGFTQK